jgi:hypothetical protein
VSEPEEPVEVSACCPEQAVGSEPDGELVVVLRPRFMRGPLAWWLQPRLPRPYFKVHLDAVGTFVWKRCDGRTTVAEIARAMQERFGDDFEQAEERLQRFLFELERGKMIRMIVPD